MSAACHFLLAVILFSVSALAQSPLQQKIQSIATAANGKVSVSCSLPQVSLVCDLDPHAHAPMQSVFKLPLALTVLHHVESKSSPAPTARCRTSTPKAMPTSHCANFFASRFHLAITWQPISWSA
jgi:hypothetical protein